MIMYQKYLGYSFHIMWRWLVFWIQKRHHRCMEHREFYPLLSIVDNMPQMLSQTGPRHAPDDVIIHCGYYRLPLDGAVIETF